MPDSYGARSAARRRRPYRVLKFGANLLVVPSLIVPITFSYGGDTFSGTIPWDSALCGTSVELQALELDPGAPFGVSFTPGLELAIGR